MQTRSAAVLKGVKDSGMNILTGDILLSDDRINAQHISTYATYLLEKDKSLYTKQFSNVTKNGLKPEQYHEHFVKVKDNIIVGIENLSAKDRFGFYDSENKKIILKFY